MRTTRLLALVVVTLAALGCSSSTAAGWTYAPAPSLTPVPSTAGSGAPSAAAPSGSAAAPASAPASAAASAAAGGTVLELAAQNVAYDTAQLSAPAGKPFQIHFNNKDQGTPHNVAIHQGSPTGPEVFKGEIFPGPAERTYDVPALQGGTYGFVCSVHPNMIGTLTVN
jgi:plastocyanin